MAEPPAAIAVIPGLPPEASARLLAVLSAEPAVHEVWLYGSRAMSAGPAPRRPPLLMGALDDLLLPWSIDLSLLHELPEPLRQHVARRLVVPGNSYAP